MFGKKRANDRVGEFILLTIERDNLKKLYAGTKHDLTSFAFLMILPQKSIKPF